MIKVIYWNIKRKSDTLFDEIVKLSQDTDILILAELTESNKKLTLKGIDLESVILTISNKTAFSYINDNIDSWVHVWARKGIDINLVEKYD